MLKGIPSIITPDLLKALDEMGHTDEITIGDGNFPGHTYGKKIIRLDGVDAVEILDAILKLFPLDDYTDKPVALMQVVKDDPIKTPIWEEFYRAVEKYDVRGKACFQEMDKWEFYKRTKEQSALVVMTGETAQYANIILRKGVVRKTDCLGEGGTCND